MEGGASASAAAAAAAPAGGDTPPCQTLYIQNLTEKVKKAPLKKSLFACFSPFGRVIDLVHCRSNALRGQAWVVFGDVASATAAMAKLQSFPLFDKPMVRQKSLPLRRLRGGPWVPSENHHLTPHTTHPPHSPSAMAAHLLCQAALPRH